VRKEGLSDDDAIAEEVETVCKTGELWQLGNQRLLCGDATKKEDVERLMGGEKISAILTDPPYGIDLDADWSGIRRTGKKDSHLPHYVKGRAYPDIIGDSNPFDPRPVLDLWANDAQEIFLFGADYYAERIPERNQGSFLVWDKRLESQADGFGSEFETIWSKRKHKRRLLRHQWFGFLRGSEQGERRVHPTQKPIALFVDIIQQWIKGSNIADPFGGSGSTLIACEKLNRRCFMMEISEAYCDVIIQRWQNFTGNQAVRTDGN
jgi:DNA modification methylase